MQGARTLVAQAVQRPATERSRYAALGELGANMADVDDLDQLGELYLTTVGRVVDFPMRAVYLFEPDSTTPRWYASRNVSERFMTTNERLGRPVDVDLHQVLATRVPVYNLAGRSIRQWRETEIYQLVNRIENMVHVLKAPVMMGGEIIGTVDFASDRVDTSVTEADLDLVLGLAGVVGGAVTALRRRQRLEQELTLARLALEISSAAVVHFAADSNEPALTPTAAALIDDLQEGTDILYRILRDSRPSVAESHRSYLVRLRNGAKDVLNCTVRAVPGQPGAEVMEIALEAAESRYIDRSLQTLSAREYDVAGLVAAGLSDREIADELTLSLYTVRQHVKNVYTKLEIGSRVQLTRVYYGKTARVSPARR